MSDAIAPKSVTPDTNGKSASSKIWQIIKGTAELLFLFGAAFIGCRAYRYVSGGESTPSASSSDATSIVTTDAKATTTPVIVSTTSQDSDEVIEFDTSSSRNSRQNRFTTDDLVFPGGSTSLQGASDSSVPSLEYSAINLGECATVSINDHNISAVTVNPELLSYKVYTQNCIIQLVTDPGTEVDTVTQAALVTNQVQVAHDCSATKPTIQVIVLYQGSQSIIQNITVDFIHRPILRIANFTLGENGEVNLADVITVADAEVPTLGVNIDGLQNAQVVSSSQQSKSIKVFSAEALSARDIKLRSNSKLAPSLTLSAFNAFATSVPKRIAPTFFPAPQFTVCHLQALQGRSFFVTNSTFDAVARDNPFPIMVTVKSSEHGWFSYAKTPDTRITIIPLDLIKQGNQVLYTPDGTAKSPKIEVIPSAGPATGTITLMSVDFDASPYAVRASSTMPERSSKTLTQSDLWFDDPDFNPNELTIIISEVKHGTINLLIFKQEVLLAGGVIVSDAGGLQFNVSGSDGVITTLPTRMQISILPTTSSTISASLEGSLITAGILGLVGLAFWRIRNKYIINRNNSLFSAGTFQDLVCRAIFSNQLKFSGCFDYMSEERTSEFSNAVEILLTEVIAANNLTINRMSSTQQELLALEIANQTIKAISPQYDCCGAFARFFKSCCVPEVTPEAIIANAKKIALAVKIVLTRHAEKKAESIELAILDEDSKQTTFTQNPLALPATLSSSTSMLSSSIALTVDSAEANKMEVALRENQRLRAQASGLLQNNSSACGVVAISGLSESNTDQKMVLSS